MQMQINILKVRQGVHMGDHAETIDNAVYVEPTKTIQELVESELFLVTWDKKVTPIDDAYLIIRVAVKEEDNV